MQRRDIEIKIFLWGSKKGDPEKELKKRDGILEGGGPEGEGKSKEDRRGGQGNFPCTQINWTIERDNEEE